MMNLTGVDPNKIDGEIETAVGALLLAKAKRDASHAVLMRGIARWAKIEPDGARLCVEDADKAAAAVKLDHLGRAQVNHSS
jgi:hypothetical protein